MLRSRSLTNIMVCRIRKVMPSTVFSPLIRCSFVCMVNTMVRKLIRLVARRQEFANPPDFLDRRPKRYELRIYRLSVLNDSAIVRRSEGSAYHFRFFQYFTNRKAAMKLIRTTGQCLAANFQNGLSSIDSRRKNSVTRLITSPEAKISLGSATVS